MKTKKGETGVLAEVSCIQYQPERRRSKDQAERIAILEVCKALRKRGFVGGIFQYALVHRNSGHVHVAVVTDEDDEEYVCRCCREAQKPILTLGGHYRMCNCGDCVACDKRIRRDMEQITRSP